MVFPAPFSPNNPNMQPSSTENDRYIISIEDDSYTNKIFKEISKYDIKMFSEEDPSLNEIFLSVVGENYE